MCITEVFHKALLDLLGMLAIIQTLSKILCLHYYCDNLFAARRDHTVTVQRGKLWEYSTFEKQYLSPGTRASLFSADMGSLPQFSFN